MVCVAAVKKTSTAASRQSALRGRVTKSRVAAVPKTALKAELLRAKALEALEAPPSPSSVARAASPARPVQSTVSQRLSVSYIPDGPLVGREKEAATLRGEIRGLTDVNQGSGSVYICGLPGTGKTLVVHRLVSEMKTQSVWVNCANLSKPRDLFSRIADALGLDNAESLEDFCGSEGARVVVVLDEADFLTTRDRHVLYGAFELARGNSRLALVVIANALDLPTRLLPWLRARRCMPRVHVFAPYTAPALAAILQARLGDSDAISSAAMKLTSRKVAACAGDARAALDMARQVAASSGGVSAVAALRTTKSYAATIRTLPVAQQLALCAAANAAANSKKKPTLGVLHAAFARLCSRAHVQALNFTDFADVCANALQHHGLLDVTTRAKTMRSRQVRLRVAVDDVRVGVADKGFLPFLVVER